MSRASWERDARERQIVEQGGYLRGRLDAVGEQLAENVERRGRPPVGPKVTGFRLEPQVLAEVEALAAAEGTTRAELLRDLVDEALAARRRKASRKGAS